MIVFPYYYLVCQEPLPSIIVSSETEYSVELYTKSGKQKKRKKFKTSVQKRKDIKKKTALEHKVLESCDVNNCKKKCITNISEERRYVINDQYWKMDTNQRKQFILNVCIPTEVKRRTVNFTLKLILIYRNQKSN